MKKQRILFIDYWPDINYEYTCGAGLGSSLFKLAAMAEASNQGFETHLLTSPDKKELLEDALGIDFIYSEPLLKRYDSFNKIINLGITEELLPKTVKPKDLYMPFLETDRKLYKNSSHLSFWRKFTAEALDYKVSAKTSIVDICLESEEVLKAVKLMPREFKWIAIPLQSVSTLKNYKSWNRVIEILLVLDPQIRIVLLGDQVQGFEENERVLNLMGKTCIQLLKAIISQVNVLTGVDGLATNIAMAFKKPTVSLFTMISPENVIDDLKSEKTISLVSNGCPYQFCYEKLINYRSSGCQYLHENSQRDSPICLDFTPETIAENVLKLIK